MKNVLKAILVMATIIISSSSLLNNQIRKIEASASIKDQACEKAGDMILDKKYKSLDEYVKSINVNPTYFELLTKLILNQNIEGIPQYLLHYSGYIFAFGIGMITFVFIIPIFWCCCCCNCGPFKKNKTSTNCCPLVFTIIFFGAIVAASIVGYAKSSNFIKHLNGTSCGMFTFFDNTLEGETKTELPRWGGLRKMPQIIQNTSYSLNTIDSNSAKIFDEPSYTEGVIGLRETYIIQTTKTIPTNKGRSYDISHPSGKGDKIHPVYSSQFENKDNTMIYQLNQEEQTVFGNSATALNLMSQAAKEIHTKLEPINSVLSTAEEKIKQFDDLISTYYNKMGNTVVTSQDKVSKYLLLAFQCLNGFFVVAAGAVLLFLILIGITKAKCFKFFTHLLWNLIMIISGLCFMIGSILGILSLVSHELIPVVNYLMSKEYLQSPDSIFVTLGDTPIYLDICLNSDGDLSKVLGFEESEETTTVLNHLYEVTLKIQEVKNTLVNLGPDSTVVPYILSAISQWENSIRSTLIPDLYAQEIAKAEGEMSKCQLPYIFVIPEEKCEVANCEQINRNSKFDFNCDLAKVILKNIQQSVVENQDKLGQAKELINEAHSIYRQLLINIINKVNETGEMTELLLDTLSPLIGDKNTFTDILNCAFFKQDIIVFLNQFGVKLSQDSQIIALTCLICSSCSFLGVLFFVSAINYLTQKRKSRKPKKYTIQINLNECVQSPNAPLLIKTQS